MAQQAKKRREGEKANAEASFRRINITIREDQYQLIHQRGLALSGLIRDLLDDRFSSSKIVLQLSKEGRALYDNLVANFGLHDSDLEEFFLKALDKFLEGKLGQLKEVRAKLGKL